MSTSKNYDKIYEKIRSFHSENKEIKYSFSTSDNTFGDQSAPNFAIIQLKLAKSAYCLLEIR